MKRQLRMASLIMRRAIERCNQHGVQIIDLQAADSIYAEDDVPMEYLNTKNNDSIVLMVNNGLRKKNLKTKVQGNVPVAREKSKTIRASSIHKNWRKQAANCKKRIKHHRSR